MAEPQQFFEHLWPGGIPAGNRLLIWTLKDKRSYFAETGEDAAGYVGDHGGRSDTYFGAALTPQGLTRSQRGLAYLQKDGSGADRLVTGIPGLWIDLDFEDPAHKKPNLPTQDEADQFISDTWDVLPHIVVNSGHGYQLWWLFDEPWLFAEDADRDAARLLAQAHTYNVRDMMRLRGWDLDATFDMARVMRVPGTTNFKGATNVMAVVDGYHDSPRQSVAEWQEALSNTLTIPVAPDGPLSANRVSPTREGGKTALRPQPARLAGSLRLDPAATPPFDKWEALQGTDPKIGKTWNRRRTDYGDQSASSYDMGLASYAVRASWSDQEIADLMVASRRKHGDDLKLREDYYVRTIDQARATIDSDQIAEAFDHDADTPLDPDEARAALSRLFGIELVALIKYLGDPPSFTAVVQHNGEAQRINLGGVEALLWQRTFRAKVAGAVGHVIPTVSPAAWDKRAQAMLNAVDEVELADEATPGGLARSWLREYLSQNHPAPDDADERAEAVRSGRPYLLPDGVAGVALGPLQTWVRTVKGERISVRDLARHLREANWGAARVALAATEDQPRTTRSTYEGPRPD